jgi:alkylhydroperoxidase/carboxymuconolactone decarboxylase family protein YurZ
MSNDKISTAFQVFQKEAPHHARAWGSMINEMNEANQLDVKTSSLVYIGILAALGMESGLPFHVAMARDAGASRDEIISAIMMALPTAGHHVTKGLQVALESYDRST